MSLGEVQQIYELLVKIDQLLSGIHVKQVEIERDAPRTESQSITVREVLRLTLRLSHLFAHMGFPPEIQSIISKLNQIIFLTRSLYVSLMLLQSTTLYGQVMGMVGLMTAAMSLPSMLEGY